MKKNIFFGMMIVFCLFFVNNEAMAGDAPLPTTNENGVFLPDATFEMGNLSHKLDVYLLSDNHGWYATEKTKMKKVAGGYRSDLVITKGTKYHPAQVVVKEGEKTMHYLEIENAIKNWQFAEGVTKEGSPGFLGK